MNWKRITAKYDSVCLVCGEEIEEGSPIMWKKGEKGVHPGCEDGGTTERRPAKGAGLSNAVIVARDKARSYLQEQGEALRYDATSSDAYGAIRLLWKACGNVGTAEAIEDFRKITETVVRLNAGRER